MKGELGTRYRLHDLRHTLATRLLESGVDALVVAALMGHSSTFFGLLLLRLSTRSLLLFPGPNGFLQGRFR